MAWKKIDDTKLTAIADAIRGKTGKTEAMTLDAMPTEISGIETGSSLEAATCEFRVYDHPDSEFKNTLNINYTTIENNEIVFKYCVGFGDETFTVLRNAYLCIGSSWNTNSSKSTFTNCNYNYSTDGGELTVWILDGSETASVAVFIED